VYISTEVEKERERRERREKGNRSQIDLL